ncbi:hypothetical protein [Bifidobacterium sp.]|jgi:hypothetical protein|uniref:hypothetical protein n=1 Tax=Bifidobacterium sp. TaxID=41200 RepID=UPI0025C58305|nr:hypothetical protein [Bifidobacterium sp.]MCI1635212.1 hypothetical protein [Bifidobacterium sp.]
MKASELLQRINGCDVKGCQEKARRVFRPAGKQPFQVCEFHYLELKTENAFMTDNQGRIVVGDEVPPLLKAMSIKISSAAPIVNMTLTKPDGKEQTVQFRVPAEDEDKWLRFLDFPFADEEPAVG